MSCFFLLIYNLIPPKLCGWWDILLKYIITYIIHRIPLTKLEQPPRDVNEAATLKRKRRSSTRNNGNFDHSVFAGDNFFDDGFFDDDFPLDPSKMMDKMFQDLDAMGFGHMNPMFSPVNNNNKNQKSDRKSKRNQRKSNKSSPKNMPKNRNSYEGSIVLTNSKDVSQRNISMKIVLLIFQLDVSDRSLRVWFRSFSLISCFSFCCLLFFPFI